MEIIFKKKSYIRWNSGLGFIPCVKNTLEEMEVMCGITDFKLIYSIYDTKLKSLDLAKFMTPLIGERFLNGYYTMAPSDTLKFFNGYRKYNFKGNPTPLFVHVITKGVMALTSHDNIKRLHIDKLISHILQSLKIIGYECDLPKRLLKMITSTQSIANGMNIWQTLSFSSVNTTFFKSLLSALNIMIATRSIGIFEILDNKKIRVLETITENSQMAICYISKGIVLDNTLVINGEVTRLMKSTPIKLNPCTDLTSLTSCQLIALDHISKTNMAQITGEGGTGKTYIIGEILKVLLKSDYEVLLVTSYCVSKKILQFKFGGFAKLYDGILDIKTIESAHYTYNIHRNVANHDILIIDEAQNNSNAQLANMIRTSTKFKKIIQIGDQGFQISPIGFGSPMYDIFNKYPKCRVKMKTNVRISKDSKLTVMCKLLRDLIHKLASIDSHSLRESVASKFITKINDNDNDISKDVEIINSRDIKVLNLMLCKRVESLKKSKKLQDWFIITPENRHCDNINDMIHTTLKHDIRTSSSADGTIFFSVYNKKSKRGVKCFPGTSLKCKHKYSYKLIGDFKKSPLRSEIRDWFTECDYTSIANENKKQNDFFISSPMNPKEIVHLLRLRYKKLKNHGMVLIATFKCKTPIPHEKEVVIEKHVETRSLELGYCTTVDSSLGAETYGCIIYFPLELVKWVKYDRCYTMISRAKSKLCIIGVKSVPPFHVSRVLKDTFLMNKNSISVIEAFIFCCSRWIISNDTWTFDFNGIYRQNPCLQYNECNVKKKIKIKK